MMHFDYKNSEDIRRELIEEASNLQESQLTDISFNGESLYSAGGGHAFLWGFYRRYLTKSAIEFIQYYSWWSIGGDKYTYDNETKEWIKKEEPKQPTIEIKPEDLTFPVVTKVAAKLIGDDIEPLKPIQ